MASPYLPLDAAALHDFIRQSEEPRQAARVSFQGNLLWPATSSSTPRFGDAVFPPNMVEGALQPSLPDDGEGYYPDDSEYLLSSETTAQQSVFSGDGDSIGRRSSRTSHSSGSHPETEVPTLYELYEQHPFPIPCELSLIGRCGHTFADIDAWIAHMIDQHLHGNLPRHAMCWYCNDAAFSSDAMPDGDRLHNFTERMLHILWHLVDPDPGLHLGPGTRGMQPDFAVFNHLRREGLIDAEAYAEARDLSPNPFKFDLALQHMGWEPPKVTARRDRANRQIVNPADEERQLRRKERDAQKRAATSAVTSPASRRAPTHKHRKS